MPVASVNPTLPTFSTLGITLTPTQGNIRITTPSFTQDVVIGDGTRIVMFNAASNCFYTLLMPFGYNAADQFVGVYSG